MPLEIATRLAEQLAVRGMRVVFAESCTGGLISAELTKVPGVSQWLCGSAVTYRCRTKVDWLDVSEDAIEQQTAVSRVVAEQMARGVLTKTIEASLSASITGHLGPDAPPEQDGLVFIGLARRGTNGDISTETREHRLTESGREPRQTAAMRLVLRTVLDTLV